MLLVESVLHIPFLYFSKFIYAFWSEARQDDEEKHSFLAEVPRGWKFSYELSQYGVTSQTPIRSIHNPLFLSFNRNKESPLAQQKHAFFQNKRQQ